MRRQVTRDASECSHQLRKRGMKPSLVIGTEIILLEEDVNLYVEEAEVLEVVDLGVVIPAEEAVEWPGTTEDTRGDLPRGDRPRGDPPRGDLPRGDLRGLSVVGTIVVLIARAMIGLLRTTIMQRWKSWILHDGAG